MPIFIRSDVSTYINAHEVRAAKFDSSNPGSGVTLLLADTSSSPNLMETLAGGTTIEDIVGVLQPILDPHELMPIVQTTDEDPVSYWFNPEHVETASVVSSLVRVVFSTLDVGVASLTVDADTLLEVIVNACAKYND